MGRKKRNSAPRSKQSPQPAEDSPETDSAIDGVASGASSYGPNDIKKATKTPEERRKEIEVRVAAARRLLQQLKSPQTQNEGDRDKRALDLSSGSGQRIGGRRKHGNMRKTGSTTDRSDRVSSYWNTMSIDMKKDLLRIRVCDLKSHFGFLKDTSVNDVLSEALSFAEANKTWKFWLCCRCNEKYSDPESHIQHVQQEHVENLLPKMRRLLPQNVDNEWIDMILNCSWKPLDVAAAVKLLENQSKCKDSTFSDNSYPGRDNLGQSLQAFRAESSDYSKIAETDIPLADGWPISDDSERAILLEKIHAIFKMLIRHKYLASSHINGVIQFAINEIQGLAAGSHLLNHRVDLSPICICFLEAPQLKKLLHFLQQLSFVCDLGRNGDKCDTPLGDSHNASEGPEIKEKIVLNEDATWLLLDECLLPTEVTPGTLQVAVLDDVTTLTSPDGVSHSNNPFLSWIYSGSSSGDQLTSWARSKEDKRLKGVEIVQLLENEFYHLQNLCEKKCEGMSYMEALRTIQDFRLEEGKKSQQDTEFVPPGYESVLRKRIEELTEYAMDLMFTGNRFELQAILYVLKVAEAKALNANQPGCEETYVGATSQLHDLESVEVDGCRMKDDYSETERTLILGQTSRMDSYIEIAMQKLRENLSLERSEIDARILRNLTKMKQLERRLEPVSAHDYRAILLPLVKLYLRAYLEDLAEKDAREKSDAATEAFLAELALDSKKVVKGGNDNTRHTEKTKAKKKKKDRKTRDLKAIGGQQQLESPIPETVSCDQVGRDTDHQDSEINVSVGGDDSEQQEEQEKMLEKALDLQRRIENEAKQKHLADQQEKLSGAYLEEVADKLQDAQLRTVADGADIHGYARPQVMENDLQLPDQRTGKEGKGHKSLSKLVVDGKIEATTLEKENIEVLGVNETKTLKELPVEDDDEETFQADLNMAISQSLETYEGHPKLPSLSGLSSPERTSPHVDNLGVTGLKNEVGEYNCFLNVIIQSLWHLSPFREEFLRRSEHNHVGNPCVVCALYEIFTAMYVASKDSVGGGVAPTSLRKALSNLRPDSNFFQEAQMNDASEVLAVIFDCLHRSFASGSSVSDSESVEENFVGSWDCDNPCIAHSLFGMDLFQRMNCNHCGLDSRHLKYTSFFHNINANALRTMKIMHGESSFDELLNLVEMNHQYLACDPEAGGCGKLNHLDQILSTPPYVFITVLGWQSTCESADDVIATLAALNTEIDISVLYRGLDPKRTHRLVSVVCYYRQHYRCFAYSHDHERWLMCDDTTVRVVGGWFDVLTICNRELLQPQVLFFEAVN